MVPGPSEHGIQADVVFVIEGTAINGAYLNDLKTNYLIPTLEYFSQGSIEDREYISENSTTLYGIVVYHAADCLPAPTTTTLGPYSNPHKLLLTLDRLEMVGGKGESHANIGEGLATALLCFEDLQGRREPNTVYQKHCILVCNSPPYQTVVQESYKYAGHTVENLATLFQERNIILSILSPRKIPALFKLFEKAGGDLQTSQTKNYAKDPRHLVLLRNYYLKERPISPTAMNVGGTVHQANSANSGGGGNSGAQIPLSPLQSHDSPNTNQPGSNLAQNSQQQAPLNSPFRTQPPNNINSHQAVSGAVGPSINVGAINAGRPNFNPQLTGPPNYHNASARASQPRWRTPFIAPGSGNVQNNTQGSALIAQLTQPPSSLGLNVPFNQRIDGNGSVPTPNSQQQQQQQPSQQSQSQQSQSQQPQQQQSAQQPQPPPPPPPQQQQQQQQQVANQTNQSPVGGQSQATQQTVSASAPTASSQTQSQSTNSTQNPSQIQTPSQASQQNQQTQEQQAQQQTQQQQQPQQVANQTGQSPVGGQNQTSSQSQSQSQPSVTTAQTQSQTQNSTQGQSQIPAPSQVSQQNQQTSEQQQATLQALQVQPTASSVPSQITSSNSGQNVVGQVQSSVTATIQPTSVNQQISHNSPQVQGSAAGVTVQQIQQIGSTGRERPTIWQGILEWLEKAKNPSDSQKQTRQVPCQVSANSKDGEPELKADSWPQKLIMQLMPKQLIGSIGGAYLKNSKSVLFHPTPCDALDSLTKVMSTGFAGCVHFTSAPSVSTCDIKVLILLYTIEKRAYLGFIPNDQTAFVDRLRKVIQHQKTTQALLRQSQIYPQGAAGPQAGGNISGTIPNPGGIAQGGILMSQTNTMAMGGGQITQNVVPGANPQQALSTNSAPQTQMAIQAGPLSSQQVGNTAPGIMVQQRPTFEGMDIARQQNLMKIHQLRQTLEAAQQQEAQYQQSQLDIHQNLEVAQQQEMQYKQQMEAQQAQKTLAANSAIAGQQPNTQRMMRPTMANNLGLRHLLQQQQPQQYRQVLGMQQPMVGPRGQMGARPMAPANPQSQQFDDVTNFDFLG